MIADQSHLLQSGGSKAPALDRTRSKSYSSSSTPKLWLDQGSPEQLGVARDSAGRTEQGVVTEGSHRYVEGVLHDSISFFAVQQRGTIRGGLCLARQSAGVRFLVLISFFATFSLIGNDKLASVYRWREVAIAIAASA